MVEMGNPGDLQLGSAALRPAPDCQLYLIEQEGVLFCEGQQELHALNTTATLVWLCLEEGKDEAAVATELSELFGVSIEETGPAVRGVIADWQQRGFLAGFEDRRLAVARPSDDWGPFPAVETPRSCYSERTYRMLDTSVKVRYATAEQEEWVHPIVAHLASDAPAPYRAEISVVAFEEGAVVLVDGSPVDAVSHIGALGPSVKGNFLVLALNNLPYLFQIHAGVLERDGQCLLLPAIAGSGKTSLTAGLLHAGWRYLSDETAPIAPDTLRVRPVPLALASKPGAWPLLSPFFPEIESLRTHLRVDGKHVRYLAPPPHLWAPDGGDGYAVRWIVFPSYQPGVKSELLPLSKVDTLRRLLAECLSLPRNLDKSEVGRLVEWAAQVDGYLLPNSDLQQAVGLVNTLRDRTVG
jgi:hypothetical protein